MSGQADFDLKKIEAVQELVLNYLKNHEKATEKELVVYIKQTGMLSDNRDYSDEGIKKILQAFVEDECVEKGQNGIFRANTWSVPSRVALTEVPCSHCPVQRDCRPDGLINPQSCQHLKQWMLDF